VQWQRWFIFVTHIPFSPGDMSSGGDLVVTQLAIYNLILANIAAEVFFPKRDNFIFYTGKYD